MIGSVRAAGAVVGLMSSFFLLPACSSGSQESGGASSPTSAARSYFAAIVLRHKAAARALACTTGWSGPRHFTFTTITDFPGHRGDQEILRQMHPTARKVADGWTVRLNDRAVGLPALRVILHNNRYFVCGYR